MASLHAFRPMSVVATPARPVAAAVRKCAVTERRRHHTHCMTDRQLFKTRPGCHWPASRDGTNSREAQKLGVSDHTNRFVENRDRYVSRATSCTVARSEPTAQIG